MAKKKTEILDANVASDELASVLVDSLNKKFKDYKVAYFLTDDAPTNVTEWVKTESSILDLIISNRSMVEFLLVE